MIARSVFALVVGVSLGLVACETIPETELKARAVPSAVVTSCRASAESLCEAANECSPHYLPFFFVTLHECIEQVAQRCTQLYDGHGATDAPPPCVAPPADHCALLTDPFNSVQYGAPDALLRSCPIAPGRRANGERCLRDGDCASARCSTISRALCGRCAATAGEGEACDAVSCGPTLRCLSNRCERPRSDGAPCTSHHECAGACRNGVCAPLLRTAGVACDADCDLSFKLACGPDRLCGGVVIASPGSRCKTDYFTNPLPGFEYCDARGECKDGVCEQRALLGEPCGPGCHVGTTCIDGSCRPTPLPDRCTL